MKARAGAWILALSVLALSPITAAPPIVKNEIPQYPPLVDGYDFRYGIPPNTQIETLGDKIIAISSGTYAYFDEAAGEKRMSGFADYHAVFNVRLEWAKSTLEDLSSFNKFMPWISGSTIQSKAGDYYKLEFSVGINFLGAKIGYLSLSECWIDSLPGSSVGLRSRMLESPDGNLFEHYLSWFLAPVIVNGQEMTYVRYYARPGLRNPSWLVSSLVSRFTEPNIRDQVASLMKEAIRRQKNAEKK